MFRYFVLLIPIGNFVIIKHSPICFAIQVVTSVENKAIKEENVLSVMKSGPTIKRRFLFRSVTAHVLNVTCDSFKCHEYCRVFPSLGRQVGFSQFLLQCRE